MASAIVLKPSSGGDGPSSGLSEIVLESSSVELQVDRTSSSAQNDHQEDDSEEQDDTVTETSKDKLDKITVKKKDTSQLHAKPSTSSKPSRGCHSYIIHGGNAASLVKNVMTEWKWLKLEDKLSTSFTLKWAELKQNIDFHSFREGEQIVNHFPNISLLTTKIGLLESLRTSKRKLHLSLRLDVNDIFPETYRMDVASEREEFFQTYKEGDLWICKPTGANQGKGIFLVHNLEQIKQKLASDTTSARASRRPTPRIVQRYISQPLLLEGRKFDIRVYMLLIAGEKQLLAFYREGYIRLSCLPYDVESHDMTIHLTNQFVQKKHPSYADIKEDTVWSFDKLQSYLSENEDVPEDWVSTALTRQLKRLMLGCYHSVCHKLEQRIGYFELLGFDFLLDSNRHVWLIEVNTNPSMNTNCDVLKQTLPTTIEETLGMAVEVWSKSRRRKPIFPIEAQKDFVTLFPT